MDWKNKPYQIFNKIKNQMFAKGVENFRFVNKFIEQFDPQCTGLLTPHYFNAFTNKIGVFLTTQQIRNIRDVYGKEGDKIAYRDLLEDVKYSIPESITGLISVAFDNLDPNCKGSVSLTTLCDTYCASKHPHVLSRRKSPQQVYEIFVTGITLKSSQDSVSRAGFVDYYADINFCVPLQRQNYFKDLLRGTWQLINSSEYVSAQHLKQLQLIMYEKIRQKSDGKTNQWKCAKKALSYFDLGDQKSCDLAGFAKALDKFGCNFKKHQTKAIFDKYDVDHSGRLDYEQFSKLLMEIDINGMSSKPNLLKTLGTNYFKITH